MKALASALLLALGGVVAAAPVAMAAHAGDSVLAVLPPEPVVRRVLVNLPSLRMSVVHGELAAADQARLAAGPYDWLVRAGQSQRTVVGLERFQEQELVLERTLRWFGKAARDKAIGEQGMAVATAMRADAWHEAARQLLNDWFAALQDQVGVLRVREQLVLMDQLHAIATKRVKAGEGARLELLQAETERGRVAALLQQAEQRQEQSLAQLAHAYPGLPLPDPTRLPLPQPVTDGIAQLQAQILHDNHELELAQSEIELAALRAQRQASDAMPDPTLSLRAVRERAGQERLIGFSVSMPLPGQARSAERNAAVLQATLARERAAQVRLKVQAAAQRTAIDCVRSYETWQALQGVQQATQQQSDLMLRAYEAGEFTLGEALMSRRQALEALLAAQGAQIEALAADARVRLDAHRIWAFD